MAVNATEAPWEQDAQGAIDAADQATVETFDLSSLVSASHYLLSMRDDDRPIPVVSRRRFD